MRGQAYRFVLIQKFLFFSDDIYRDVIFPVLVAVCGITGAGWGRMRDGIRHKKLHDSVVGHLKMRNAGTQLRSWNAALIPLAGVLLGAIDPAIDAAWANPKRNPANTPGRAHLFSSAV